MKREQQTKLILKSLAPKQSGLLVSFLFVSIVLGLFTLFSSADDVLFEKVVTMLYDQNTLSGFSVPAGPLSVTHQNPIETGFEVPDEQKKNITQTQASERDESPDKNIAVTGGTVARGQTRHTSPDTLPQPQIPVAGEPQTILPSMEELNNKARETLVNILCTTSHGGSFQPITATGVVIDPRGIILTNAHVAQYLLLAQYADGVSVECLIRTGSPAHARYQAEILYISSRWIEKNATSIIEDNPLGTGENDYALLLITATTDPHGTLPDRFAFISPEFSSFSPGIATGDAALLAGYPAGFLGGISVQKDLYITSAVATVGQLFTFHAGSIDLFSVGGTVLSQKGVSGGAVVRHRTGLLTGIVVTSSEAPTTGERDLRAISLSHINQSFTEETGISLATLLESESIGVFKQAFSDELAPTLAKSLIETIQKTN